jgi:hypothetical protein
MQSNGDQSPVKRTARLQLAQVNRRRLLPLAASLPGVALLLGVVAVAAEVVEVEERLGFLEVKAVAFARTELPTVVILQSLMTLEPGLRQIRQTRVHPLAIGVLKLRSVAIGDRLT